MRNKSNIIFELKKVFKKEEEKSKEKKTNERLASANVYYNNLIEKGLLKKRGYTLKGIEDGHLFSTKLNGY